MTRYVRQRFIPVLVTVGGHPIRAEIPYGTDPRASQWVLNQLKLLALAHLKTEHHAPIEVVVDGQPLGSEASWRWVRQGWIH